LDLGCGTGILSAFAIKSGAKEVFSIWQCWCWDPYVKEIQKNWG
jgi:predicted RNA methylase